tara:strand:+ start:98 stop:709 length:612 start_codon:yes stop_codon:yes gene_type:complete
MAKNMMPMLAGVGLLSMCCISSSIAASMMGGGETVEETKPAETTPVVPTLPSGRYVLLENIRSYDASSKGNDDDKHKIINLAEVEVFAKGGTTSLAAGKPVDGTMFRSESFPGSNFVDGNFTNFGHTWGRDESVHDQIKIDLGSVQEIEKIKITNRVDCCKDRAQGIKALILAADGTTIVKDTPAITTTADTYTFTFPGTTWA